MHGFSTKQSCVHAARSNAALNCCSLLLQSSVDQLTAEEALSCTWCILNLVHPLDFVSCVIPADCAAQAFSILEELLVACCCAIMQLQVRAWHR